MFLSTSLARTHSVLKNSSKESQRLFLHFRLHFSGAQLLAKQSFTTAALVHWCTRQKKKKRRARREQEDSREEEEKSMAAFIEPKLTLIRPLTFFPSPHSAIPSPTSVLVCILYGTTKGKSGRFTDCTNKRRRRKRSR